MNLPSSDEQLDLHGSLAQLPFEQTLPQSRASIKASHDSLRQGKALIVSNSIITSAGTQDRVSPTSDGLHHRKNPVPPVPLAAPVTMQLGQNRPLSPPPTRVVLDESILSFPSSPNSATVRDDVFVQTHPKQQEEDEKGEKEIFEDENQFDPSSSTVQSPPMLASATRPLKASNGGGNSNNMNGFGTLAVDSGVLAQDSYGTPPLKPTRVENFVATFKRFMGFVGPGYLISVGYMDPGNWATDLAGGSSFGYMLLFIILLSNVMAVVLQGLAIKLGVVSGLDLAQACRKFTPKYVSWTLYVLAELAIIACDLAEVIGSAIALNLLFKIPLPWGVVITAADVLVILFAFRDDQSIKSRRLFEALVILLVSGVGICFTAEIVYSEPVAKDVFRGFLPSLEILTNSEALYLSIGIIGATVMPHNLYLHSSIVKLRTSRELNRLASSQGSKSSTSDLMAREQRQTMLDEGKDAVSLKHSTIRSTLRYTFWDSTVALTYATYVNSAILIVSAATFKYKYPDADNSGLADFFDAFHLLSQYLGKVAGYVFAVALLIAGQSSTLTATLAGQIIMEGFLGTSYLKPWVRRLLTRCLAIIPALTIAIVKGQNGLSQLLLASQVALSIQLPFAVIPLVLFTSMGRCMTIPVQDNEDKPGDLSYSMQYTEDANAVNALTTRAVENADAVMGRSGDEEYHTDANDNGLVDSRRGQEVDAGVLNGSDNMSGARSRPQILHNFANAWWLVIISVIISIILLGLNFYLLVLSLQGN